MINVKVLISGIIMCCDENFTKLNLGNGYVAEKYDFEELFFKDKIVDGKGLLKTDYYASCIKSTETVSFICI